MEDIKNPNDEIQEEEVELEDESELLDNSTEDDSSDVENQLKRKDEIIRQLTARAKQAEALSKTRENKLPNSNDEIGSVKKTVAQLKFAEEKRQFGYEHGLAPDEVDYIFKVNNKPTKELLADPFIKGGLEAIRTQKKLDNNTPSVSSRSPRFEIPKKEDLTPQEKQENFEKWTQERFKKE